MVCTVRAGILSLASTPGVWFEVRGGAEAVAARPVSQTCRANERIPAWAEMIADAVRRVDFGPVSRTLSMLDSPRCATLKEDRIAGFCHPKRPAREFGFAEAVTEIKVGSLGGNPAYKPWLGRKLKPGARPSCYVAPLVAECGCRLQRASASPHLSGFFFFFFFLVFGKHHRPHYQRGPVNQAAAGRLNVGVASPGGGR